MGNFNRGSNNDRGDRGGRGRSFDRPKFGSDRQMYEATCDSCGKTCRVPFRPSGEKPVYCSDCFEKRGAGPKGVRPERSGRPSQSYSPSSQQPSTNKAELEALGVKLDKIIQLLTPAVVEVAEAKPKAKKKAAVKKAK